MNNVCYNNLFKLLIDTGLKKSDLARMCNLSSPTMAKLSKNECEYPSEGLNYNSDINNVRMWIILFLY